MLRRLKKKQSLDYITNYLEKEAFVSWVGFKRCRIRPYDLVYGEKNMYFCRENKMQIEYSVRQCSLCFKMFHWRDKRESDYKGMCSAQTWKLWRAAMMLRKKKGNVIWLFTRRDTQITARAWNKKNDHRKQLGYKWFYYNIELFLQPHKNVLHNVFLEQLILQNMTSPFKS